MPIRFYNDSDVGYDYEWVEKEVKIEEIEKDEEKSKEV